jgi:hypothetical protein
VGDVNSVTLESGRRSWDDHAGGDDGVPLRLTPRSQLIGPKIDAGLDPSPRNVDGRAW